MTDKIITDKIIINDMRKEIIDAYVWMRTNNTTIPDWVLDLMKDSAIHILQEVFKENKWRV